MLFAVCLLKVVWLLRIHSSSHCFSVALRKGRVWPQTLLLIAEFCGDLVCSQTESGGMAPSDSAVSAVTRLCGWVSLRTGCCILGLSEVVFVFLFSRRIPPT